MEGSPAMTSQPEIGTTVVAGVDPSPTALEAARFAADEAYRRGLSLTLVHGFTWPWTTGAGEFDADPDPHARRRASRQLARAAQVIHDEYPGLPVRERIVDGHPGEVLVDYSRQAALLVVGHRGEGGFSELLAGSIAIHTAAHAHCPVIVVRGTPGKPNAPVMVGVDGSAESDSATGFAFEIAVSRGAPLVAVTVSPPGRAGPGPLAGDFGTYTARYPEVVARREMVLHQRSAAGGLIEAADGAALIVVGSRGVGGLRGLLLGSVGRALIEHAPCPVAIVRPVDHVVAPLGSGPRA
jgi:nucleotide-binding universal stress UspA family protein